MKFKFVNLNIQVALALSAASALIYEVVATHVLWFYFIKSSYSIATVLSVFLFGLATGSIFIYYISNRVKNKRMFWGFSNIYSVIRVFCIK